MIYEFTLKLLSPAIITQRVEKEGYITFKDKIPGSVVRGALLTTLFEEGVLDHDRLIYESKNPSISITTAIYSRSEENKIFENLWLTHAFTRVSKTAVKIGDIKGKPLVSILKGKLGNLNDNVADFIMDAEGSFMQESLELLKKTGLKVYSPLEFKPCAGCIAEKIKEKLWFPIKAKHESSINIGIHRGRGSVESGMLFHYEAIQAGQIFKGFLATSDINLESRYIIRVGRGGSRGFGNSLLEVKEIRLEEFLRRIQYRDINKGDIIPLLCFTPYATIKSPYLSMIPPSNLSLPTSWMRRFSDFEGKIILKFIAAIGGYGRYTGFSIRTGLPKPTIKTVREGSILLYKVEEVRGSHEEAIKILAMSTLVGVNNLATLGLSHLYPLFKDPFPSVSELGVTVWS